MPRLEYETVSTPTYRVGYSAFNQFVQEYFGQEYHFVADQECGNDSTHEFYVTEGENFFEEDIKQFEETGKYRYLAGSILEYLCFNEEIPAGTWIVEVCW